MDVSKLPLFVRKILASRRKRRVEFLLAKINTRPNMKVIDIGCGIDGRSFEDHAPTDWHIVGVDLHDKARISHKHQNFKYLKHDAQDLSQFANSEFDLAISVGMLEHITDDVAFERIASEIQRVAKQHVVVVPYKYCWLEPHYGVPFFPLLPYAMKVALVKICNLSNQRAVLSKDPDYIRRNYRWLSNAEYQRVFPDSRIYLSPTWETIVIAKTK